MNKEYLAGRFADLWRESAGTDPGPVWADLVEHYEQPHRFYHSLGHLCHCLRELDAAKDHVAEFQATELAIWFHDIIYIYGANDNEMRSAAYFRNVAGPHMPAELVERVCEFIMATQHTGAAGDEAIAFVVDIDLSGFGLPWDDYLADSDALRQEAGDSVSDEQYYQGKLRFLTELQSWSSLFQTEHFRDRLERAAQANITRYTSDLRARGFGEDAICRA